MVCAPLAAHALQERNITDEPSVNKPQAPAKPAQPAPAAPADKAPSKPETQAPEQQSYQPSSQPQPSAGGSWTPGESKEAAKQDSAPQTGQSSGKIFDMPEAKQVQVSTYSRKEVDEQVMGFFEGGARGLADLISRAFEKYGEPTGFIKGNEGAGALVVGLRYGEGWLYLKNGKKVYVYWQSPSVGFDLGVNASKVFCMIYNMTDPEQIFQRYPSIDGSAYIVGGFGMNYQQSGKVILAPIRFGVGLRLGANVGYMHFTRERTINPF
ncbi:MAG: DUF1134 domain-containing protein [Desulfovibrio sp.]|nr:DUF1134 domain-containing protein [Desulfovibrio sp.]MBI4961598.1 DUF1134 domain-containing protein [Desulfovibrio sp.]